MYYTSTLYSNVTVNPSLKIPDSALYHVMTEFRIYLKIIRINLRIQKLLISGDASSQILVTNGTNVLKCQEYQCNPEQGSMDRQI